MENPCDLAFGRAIGGWAAAGGRGESTASLHRCRRGSFLAFDQQVSNERAHEHGAPRWRSIGRDSQGAAVDGLDLLDRLVAFQLEQRLARADGVAVALEPADEGPFLHGPAEARDDDFVGHGLPYSSSNVADCACDAVHAGDDRRFQRRAVRRRRERPVAAGGSARRGRRSRGRRPARRSPRRCRTGRTPRRRSAAGPSSRTDAQDRLDVERRDRARVDHLDRDALAPPARRTPPASGAPCGPARRRSRRVPSRTTAAWPNGIS